LESSGKHGAVAKPEGCWGLKPLSLPKHMVVSKIDAEIDVSCILLVIEK